MDSLLNKQRIDYLFWHLQVYYRIDASVLDRIIFTKDELTSNIAPGKIYFPVSQKALSPKIIGEIPILFPLSDEEKVYSIINKSLVFHHDLLRSAFYLLSGYQEYFPKKRDQYGRYRAAESIQYRLNMIQKPLVNYYFEWIFQGIEAFAEIHSLPLPKRNITQAMLFLSHDIDRISYFNQYQFRAKLKRGLRENNIRPILKYSKQFIRYCLGKIKDPYWNFDRMLEIEAQLGIHSTWFFLDKDIPHQDAYYQPDDAPIRSLIKKLEAQENEIGLHGLVRSATSEDILKKQKNRLESVLGHRVDGIRQHRLRYQMPKTADIHQNQGFRYDCTLGFAAYEGFRNGIAYPFKLYNFKEEKAFDQWEIPLNVMDGTLFEYRRYTYAQAKEKVDKIAQEVLKFNGVFSLLWHNSMLNELEYYKIESYYTQLLAKLSSDFLTNSIAKNIINDYSENNQQFCFELKGDFN
jgi:peptidoglycan/xylan/chitin deacetylase (PgdA/CDA1 family)